MDRNRFKTLIEGRCGLGFKWNPLFEDGLDEAVRERMSKTGFDSLDAYHAWLVRDAEEIYSLIKSLTVQESYFFRERHHFDLLVNHWIPKLLRSHARERRPLNILSAGCAAGEETYSIVMALLEAFGEEILTRVSVMGVDINRETIEKARKGCYTRHSFRGMDPAIESKYFRSVDGSRMQLDDLVRRAVRFEVMNLADRNRMQELGPTHLIFYRNVSYYFDMETRERIFNHLSERLVDGGYLVLGSVETSLHDMGRLRLQMKDGHYFYCKQGDAPPSRKGHHPAGVPEIKMEIRSRLRKGIRAVKPVPPKRSSPVRAIEDPFKRAEQLFAGKKWDPALKSLDEFLAIHAKNARALEMKAEILIQMHRLDDAEKICKAIESVDPWSVDCRFLLGNIALERGDLASARLQFREAVYLQPESWLAHYYLADVLLKLNEARGAYQQFGLASKLLGKTNGESTGRTYLHLSYSRDDLMHLCQTHMKNLQAQMD